MLGKSEAVPSSINSACPVTCVDTFESVTEVIPLSAPLPDALSPLRLKSIGVGLPELL